MENKDVKEILELHSEQIKHYQILLSEVRKNYRDMKKKYEYILDRIDGFDVMFEQWRR